MTRIEPRELVELADRHQQIFEFIEEHSIDTESRLNEVALKAGTIGMVATTATVGLAASPASAETLIPGGAVVQTHDSLWGISRDTGESVKQISLANGISNPSLIYPGEKLKINSISGNSNTSINNSGNYVLRSGDTFWALEQSHGWSHGTLQTLNPEDSPTNLKISNTIKTPSSTNEVVINPDEVNPSVNVAVIPKSPSPTQGKPELHSSKQEPKMNLDPSTLFTPLQILAPLEQVKAPIASSTDQPNKPSINLDPLNNVIPNLFVENPTLPTKITPEAAQPLAPAPAPAPKEVAPILAPAQAAPGYTIPAENAPTVFEQWNISSEVKGKSGFSAADYNKVLEGTALAGEGEAVAAVEAKYNINGLFIIAHQAVESEWGKSYFARTRNNYFGIGAYTDNPDHAFYYSSPQACLDAYATLLADSYLQPGQTYYAGTSVHGIFVHYSTSDTPYNEIHGIAEDETIVGIINKFISTLTPPAPVPAPTSVPVPVSVTVPSTKSIEITPATPIENLPTTVVEKAPVTTPTQSESSPKVSHHKHK